MNEKKIDAEIFNTMTMLWIKSKQDIEEIVKECFDFYNILQYRPTPEKRWQLNWVSIEKELEVLQKIKITI